MVDSDSPQRSGDDGLSASVRSVIDAVRERGDAALCEFTARWDRVELQPGTLRVEADAIANANTSSPFAQAFGRAARRIRNFHEQVKPRTTLVEDEEGVRLGMRWTPLSTVGLYIPGGKASYPSTLAMTAVPAQIAGVERVVVVSPPGPDGEVSEQVLMAAKTLGVEEIYRVGGSQAIAALAIGTETIPRVDKIFGPGNAFVAEAKKQLYGEVGIDMLAGPSEIVVYADESAEPEWVAADLMAQAEHDEATRVTLLATSRAVARAVSDALERLVADEPRGETIRTAWEKGGRVEVVATPSEATALINEIAPEHLSLQVTEPWSVLPGVRNAGAIYVGRYSPVAVGDYYAGPNHVLPTGTTARFSSCLSVEDFMKRSSICETDLAFLTRNGSDVEALAEGERLPAHATSVRLRRESVARVRPRPGLRSVPPYTLVEEDAEVKLNQNESPWDLPDVVKDEVARRLKDLPWNRYHQSVPGELEAELAKGAGVDPDCVVAASGSNLLLQWIFEAYAPPGSTVVYPSPSFSLYPLWAGVCEARSETVALTETFEYDVESFADAIRRFSPAITVLCLPNNPTGSELNFDAVRGLAEIAGERGGLLVVDEAYREFSGLEYERTALSRELDNVILVRTFSKAFAAAGMRLGYLVAPAAVATELRKIVPPFHLNLFVAVLGMTLLERRSLFDDRNQQIVSERARVCDQLQKLKGVEVFPSHANFFLFRVKDADGVFEALQQRGVLVRQLGKDPLLLNCLRVNIGTPEENERFLSALQEIIN